MKDFSLFEKKVESEFRNKALLQQAFTHRSYLNEHRSVALEHNERLEFLGDAVLELVVTAYLFAKYPDRPEGELTAYRSALVNTSTLSAVALGLGMGDYLLLSRGEAKDVGRARQYILANTFEAVVGAIYLDRGYEDAKVFISGALFGLTDDIVSQGLYHDSKSRFQERSQEYAGVTPSYRTLEERGPDHDKFFIVGAFLGEDLVAQGDGKSKQEAEQQAARSALEAKGWG